MGMGWGRGKNSGDGVGMGMKFTTVSFSSPGCVPSCIFKTFKLSFINRCLFKFL